MREGEGIGNMNEGEEGKGSSGKGVEGVRRCENSKGGRNEGG